MHDVERVGFFKLYDTIGSNLSFNAAERLSFGICLA